MKRRELIILTIPLSDLISVRSQTALAAANVQNWNGVHPTLTRSKDFRISLARRFRTDSTPASDAPYGIGFDYGPKTTRSAESFHLFADARNPLKLGVTGEPARDRYFMRRHGGSSRAGDRRATGTSGKIGLQEFL